MSDREKLIQVMRRGEVLRQAAWNAYADEEDPGPQPQSDNWYRAEALLAAGVAPQKPSENAVERAAEAMCAAMPQKGGGSQIVYEDAEVMARAALTAVDALSGLTALDQDRLAHLIGIHAPKLAADGRWLGCECEGFSMDSPNAWGRHVASELSERRAEWLGSGER